MHGVTTRTAFPRDHLRIRVAERTLDLAESTRTVEQILDDEQRPFVPDERKGAREILHNAYFIGYYLLFASIERTVRRDRKKGDL